MKNYVCITISCSKQNEACFRVYPIYEWMNQNVSSFIWSVFFPFFLFFHEKIENKNHREIEWTTPYTCVLKVYLVIVQVVYGYPGPIDIHHLK